ncbi:MFS transporter [Facilibium subflavum]|uniref:MFS transporter n=1 Tax=Facilibium subflavum TaxID=2219058 RepID=UPI000E64B943|nr:MFS transporter [Facilibium subflavum]
MLDSVAKSKALFAILLCTPFFGVAIDLYTPSFPYMQSYFQTSALMIKWTVSSFMMGSFIGMLLFGTLAERFGRRGLMLANLLLFVILAILVMMATSILGVIVLRFLMGIAVGATASINRAQTSDIFSATEIMKVSSTMTIIWGLGPIVAPFIGGYLQHYIGWQANFGFLALYCVIIFFAMYAYVPEAYGHKKPLKLKLIASNYKKILSNLQFVSAVLQCGILYGIMIFFSILGPFYIQTKLGYSAVFYGYLALGVGLFYLAGTLTRRLLIQKGERFIMRLAFSLMLIVNIVCLLLSLMISGDLLLLLVDVYLSVFSAGLLYSIFLGRCLSIFPELAGTAGAISGAGVMLTIAAISAIGGVISVQSLSGFLLIFLITALISCLIHYFER